jgi:hypothetical protein
MSPELFFWFSLAVKMVITAGFVVVATVIAERAGPLIGGLIATLPISAGPVYAYLALEHNTQFLADSAVASLAINPAIAAYLLVYAYLAQSRGWAISISIAFLLWFALAIVIHAFQWTLGWAIAFNIIVLPPALLLGRRLRDATIPRTPAHWTDIVARAILVAILVAGVVALSIHIGPSATGILALFPIVVTSIMFILHRRVGGKAAAAVMANSLLGLFGLGIAFVVVYATVVPLGAAAGLILALLTSMGWGLFAWFAKTRGLPL